MNKTTLSFIAATLLSSGITHAEETLAPIDVISTNKTEQSITQTTADISVITSEDIEERGYQTVAQILNTVAGISVNYSGGIGQQTSFFMRGMDSGKILVLLDGMRLNDPSTTNGTALLDALTTANIQQIEIIKGGSSSIWGSNASAGVINIITKTPKEGVHGSLAFTAGSYQTRGVDADLSYNDDKLSAQILASYLDSDSFSALTPRDAESDSYNNKNINLKLGYAFDTNNRIKFNYNRYRTKTDYDDPFSVDQANDDYSHATADQINYAGQYDFTSGNYHATLTASKGDFERDYYTTGFFGDGHNVYRATIKEYAFINSYDYQDGKVVLGLEYKDIDGFNQYNTFPESKASYTDKAFYLSNLYNINDDTLLETNIRYDRYDAFENKTTYKIGLKHHYRFLEGFTTAANYYTSYDAPSSYQLATPAPGELLKPSYTRGFDISAAYKTYVKVTYFNNKVEDGIDYDYTNYGYYNIDGKEKFSGMEITGNYTFSTLGLALNANYTHLFTYEKEDGTDLARRAKDLLNASVTYYGANGIYAGVDAQYVGDRTDTDGAFPPNDVQTGNYTVWNANFGIDVTKTVKFSLHARNLFNKEYQSVYGYATEGRSIYAKLKYSF